MNPQVASLVIKSLVDQPEATNQKAFSMLTDREREVLQLIADGQTTKEIALKLNVSTKTIESHRRLVMGKLNKRNVAELTKYAIREGITSI